jgi:hypothetical protein
MTRLSSLPTSTLPSLALELLTEYEASEFGLRIDSNGAPASIYANAARNVYCTTEPRLQEEEEILEEECIARVTQISTNGKGRDYERRCRVQRKLGTTPPTNKPTY